MSFIALIAGSTHVRAQEIWCSIWSTSADRPSGMYALDASAADTAFTLVLTRNEAGFSAQARKFVNIPTTSTGVGGVKTTAVAADGAYYDLNGRRVTAPARGTIYIHNGKKVKLSR